MVWKVAALAVLLMVARTSALDMDNLSAGSVEDCAPGGLSCAAGGDQTKYCDATNPCSTSVNGDRCEDVGNPSTCNTATVSVNGPDAPATYGTGPPAITPTTSTVSNQEPSTSCDGTSSYATISTTSVIWVSTSTIPQPETTSAQWLSSTVLSSGVSSSASTMTLGNPPLTSLATNPTYPPGSSLATQHGSSTIVSCITFTVPTMPPVTPLASTISTTPGAASISTSCYTLTIGTDHASSKTPVVPPSTTIAVTTLTSPVASPSDGSYNNGGSSSDVVGQPTGSSTGGTSFTGGAARVIGVSQTVALAACAALQLVFW